MNEFSLEEFNKLSTAPRSPSMRFPLKVEGYDLSGKVHFIQGVNLTTGERVKVFLRALKGDAKVARASVADYGNDPCAGWTEADFRDSVKRKAAEATLNWKCYTPPGGVLMVQGAYEDSAAGAISASWLNKVAGSQSEMDSGETVIFSPIVARMSKPYYPQDMENGSVYAYCEALFADKAEVARSQEELDKALFDALSVSASSATGKFIVAIRLVDTSSGAMSALVIERKAEKVEGGSAYVNESPATTLDRFWNTMMSPEYKKGLVSALASGQVEAIVIPGTRWRVVGKSLETLVDKAPEKRQHLQWEQFLLPAVEGQRQDTGWLECSVVLGRFKSEGTNAPDGDEDYFLKSIWPVVSRAEPAPLKSVAM